MEPARAAQALTAGMEDWTLLRLLFFFGLFCTPLAFLAFLISGRGLYAEPRFMPLFVLWATLTLVSVVLLPRANFRALHRKPLLPSEVENLLQYVRDEQERAYLTLVADATRQEVTPETEKSVRAALCALGEALERLPTANALPEEAGELRRQAQALQEVAGQEEDEVVAGSQVRQAETLRRLADITEHSSKVTRRADALRSEMATQMRALHASLTLPTRSGTLDSASLMHLADSVRRVASEAASVAAAQAELGGVGVPRAATEITPHQDTDTLHLRIGR